MKILRKKSNFPSKIKILADVFPKKLLLFLSQTPSSLFNKFLVNEEAGINTGLPCTSDFGSPVFPYLAVGGYNSSVDNYWTGQALILSFINRNIENTYSEAFARVAAWERMVKHIVSHEFFQA